MQKRIANLSERHAAEVASLKGDIAAAHDCARRSFEQEIAEKEKRIEELRASVDAERQNKDDAERVFKQECEYKLYQARTASEKAISDVHKAHELNVMRIRMHAQEAEAKAKADAKEAINAARKEFETRCVIGTKDTRCQSRHSRL